MLAEVHCNCQTVTSKTGSTWKRKEHDWDHQLCSVQSRWRASWVGLPACGAAHWGLLSVADPFWVQAGPPICASVSSQAPGSNEVTVPINFHNSRHEWESGVQVLV